MYTDNEIETIKEQLRIVKEEKQKTQNQKYVKNLEKVEKEIAASLISKFYRLIHYSKFNTEMLIEFLVKLISIVENKDMDYQQIYTLKRIGYGQLLVNYTEVVIKEKADHFSAFYEDRVNFEKAIKNKNTLVLLNCIGEIPKEIEVFELVKKSLIVNKYNMNLDNIQGVEFNIDLGERQYLKDYIALLVAYKFEHNIMDLGRDEMANITNEYAIQVIKEKTKQKRKTKSVSE